jgi:hypothetical protein
MMMHDNMRGYNNNIVVIIVLIIVVCLYYYNSIYSSSALVVLHFVLIIEISYQQASSHTTRGVCCGVDSRVADPLSRSSASLLRAR